MARPVLLLYSIDYLRRKRNQGLLQPLLRQRAVIQLIGWKIRFVPKKRYSKMDEKQSIPIWFSYLLLCYVLFNALEYVFGFCRGSGFEAGNYTALDVQSAMALGIPRNLVSSRRCTICLRLLQCYVNIHHSRIYYYDTV